VGESARGEVVFPPLSYYNAIIVFHCRTGGDVLFSRDTLPPLVLVVLIRYSKTTAKPLRCDSWQSGTRSLVWVGSGVASFHQRRTTDADTHHQTMNTTTPFFAPILPLQLSEEGINKLDAICLEVTEKFFRKDYADKIMDTLKYSRAAGKGYFKTTPDFRHFIGIYHWVKSHCSYDDYVVFRKYLQTLSAVYRWHFGHYQSVTVYNYLHERVKIETHCEHCGSLSKTLIDRLIAENLWAV